MASEVSFIWSENEYATSETLREQYWIYHLRSFMPPANEPILTKIQDPAEKHQTGRLSLRPISFEAVFKDNFLPILSRSMLKIELTIQKCANPETE